MGRAVASDLLDRARHGAQPRPPQKRPIDGTPEPTRTRGTAAGHGCRRARSRMLLRKVTQDVIGNHVWRLAMREVSDAVKDDAAVGRGEPSLEALGR
jgi:hypothetical protein